VGTARYDLLCSADDFVNTDLGSTMPTLPASSLSFAGRGFVNIPAQPFSTIPVTVDTADGSKYRWNHDYVFDLKFTAPWAFEPGIYKTTVMYSVVPD
jgi:hypothetical protein